MRRPIILSVILFIAIVCLAVLYFRNLSTPGSRTAAVLNSIPNNAALIFEFKNEDSFYEIYNGNKLFASVVGEKQLSDLKLLRSEAKFTTCLSLYLVARMFFYPFTHKKITA